MSTTTNLDTLKINYLTQEQYDEALENGDIEENEIYMTPSDVEVEDLVAKNIVVTGDQTIAGDLNIAGSINFNGGLYNGNPISATGTATVTAAQTYPLASITLPANGRYLILAHVNEGIGSGNIQSICSISITGGVSSAFGASSARTYASAGQGVSHWYYTQTGSSAATATVNCYGYYTTSHSVTGYILAIPV